MARGDVAEEIQPHLAQGFDLAGRSRSMHQLREVVAPFSGLMRMDARGGEAAARVGPRQGDGSAAAHVITAGNHQLFYAGGHRAFDDLAAVVVEAFVGEIGADINQEHIEG